MKMRVKISALTCSPKADFWYLIDNKQPTYSIRNLQKDINKLIHPTEKSKRLSLSLDGFRLLPNCTVQGLIRDGDTLTLQHIDTPALNEKSTHSKKRKKSDSSVTHEEAKDKTRVKKKHKTTKIKEKNHSSKRRRLDTTSHIDDDKKISNENAATSSRNTNEETTPDNKVLRRTRSRNMRRRQQRQKNRAALAAQQQSANLNNNKGTTNNTSQALPVETVSEDSITAQDGKTVKRNNKYMADEEPLRQLVKKNKNKKKNFLKEMENNQRSHVIFSTNDNAGQNHQDDYYSGYTNEMDYNFNTDEYNNYLTSDVYNPSNTLGGAFITDSGSPQKYYNSNKGNRQRKEGNNNENYANRQYPVDDTDLIFYASREEEEEEKQDEGKVEETGNKDTVDSQLDNNNNNDSGDNEDDDSSDSDDTSDSDSDDTSDSDNDDDENDDDSAITTTKEGDDQLEVHKVIEKVDYDKYPATTFQGSSPPVVGDLLALKTLHLSETYTPEISNWKEVKVVELNGQEMVAELVGQDISQLTKTKGRRKFDLPPDDDDDQEPERDNIETYNYTDIIDMRRIVL
ncbi:uncharacterized protein BX664DRAFT_357437 [Halteromyces radiatus]|uniref:uncharacterized protein n=1 Tax=Halteromyces radiatus TaxID=101107 RepID=UPI00221F61E5|nr:uncharacterized protein BX664DRAFT_357437 [Halteromyces radiatus]KAI8092950.1 hypothetical protein BX664DRAFT_357437 [Halteromyces radiatus]